MLKLITNQAKFLKLVANLKIIPPLKSYNDTLLFYYLGQLTIDHAIGDLLEIGVGGSTYTLHELAQVNNRMFNVVDHKKNNLDTYSRNQQEFKSIIQNFELSSQQLPLDFLKQPISYSHIDGSKEYNDTLHDLELCLFNLASRGLICQDDYGNNKWPTVTDAVQTLINQNRVRLVLVGDSSAWLTRVEDYSFWMDLLNNDQEFKYLQYLMGIHQSTLSDPYWFLNALLSVGKRCEFTLTDEIFDYYDNLIKLDCPSIYLQMPYYYSVIGYNLRMHDGYALEELWDYIKSDAWPDAPTTQQDIDAMPKWLTREIIEFHGINDLYAQKKVLKKTCVRGKLNELSS
jgi:hypothetical protein